MSFNSLEFILLLSSVLVLIRLFGRRSHQLFILLLASYCFYGWWNWRYLFLLLSTTLLDYLLTNAMAKSPRQGVRRLCLWTSIITNLGVLCYFKYANFFFDSTANLLNQFGMTLPPWSTQVLLPVGISFYVFQNLSYVVDVYRGTMPVERNFWRYSLFIAFFPQLVAGPILRAGDLLPQLKQKLSLIPANWVAGLKIMMIGFVTKVVFADNLAAYVDQIYGNVPNATGPQLVLATIFFGFQIYGDFMGYSLIAIGSARLMGIRFIDNFNKPYLSLSLSEFWRRWHISLSTWFRDYVYIPLGGSKLGGLTRLGLVLLIVFTLSGLWHGANWTFVCWGAGHGTFVFLEKLLQGRFPKMPVLAKRLYVFVVAMGLWVFFRSPDLTTAIQIFHKIGTNFDFTQINAGVRRLHFLPLAALCAAWLPVEHALTEWRSRLSDFWFEWRPVRILAYQAGIFSIWLLGNWGEVPFIYFQF